MSSDEAASCIKGEDEGNRVMRFHASQEKDGDVFLILNG
jgi:hypothetical protein